MNLSNEEFQYDKQRMPDNYLSFVPKTGTMNFDKTQMFEIAIPRTNHVIRLNKAYAQVILNIDMKPTKDVSGDTNWYVGFNNAACIFDQVQIKNNGRTILSDTYSQISSRIWQMSKSKEYLDSMPWFSLNYKDISKNVGFTYMPVKDLGNTAGVVKHLKYRMRIPIGALFQCFDNCDNFSTTQLTDDIVLSMELSEPYKYLTLVKVKDAANKDYSVEKVIPFTANGGTGYDSVVYTGDHQITIDNSAGTDEYYIENFKMNVPCHYPTPEEKEAFGQLISGGSVSYPFKSCEIDQYSVDFENTTKVVANFASNAPNMFGIMMLFTQGVQRTVFDKPFISDIECNLNEIIKLANNRVHTDATYNVTDTDGKSYGTDYDIYRDFCNNMGVDIFHNLGRIDDAITHDYFVQSPSDENMWGSYLQYFQIAAGNMLGFSGDYFANLINYKCTNMHGKAKGVADAHNHSDAYAICAQLCQRMLIFKDGGLTIATPFSDEMNMRTVMNDDNSGNQSHGVITKLITSLWSPIKDTFGGVKNFFRDQIYRIKGNKNSTYAYSTLGKEGYDNNREIIEQNLNMNTRKFRDFVDRLKAAQHGLFIRHGVGTNGFTGGSSAPIDNATGIPRAKEVLTDASANINTDNEKGITLEDINLPDTFNRTYQLQVYDKDYKSRIIMDYKFGFNRSKLKLTSFGNEMSMENMNHGFRSWLKDKWSKFTGWFKKTGKQAVHNVVDNAKNIVKQYAQDILTGKINIRDVPDKFKNQVESMIREGKFTGTEFDKLGQDAIDWYHKLKSGQAKPSDVPKAIFDKIKDLSISMSGNGSSHGFYSKHGFIAPVTIHPSIPAKNMKTRISMLLDKNPQLLTQKDLRRMFMFKYMKAHQNDGHGISRETWRKLKYGAHHLNMMKKPIAPAFSSKVIETTHGLPFNWQKKMDKYKKLKKQMKLIGMPNPFADKPKADGCT